MTAPHQWKVRVLPLTLTGENVKLAPRSQIFLTGGGPRLGAWSCCLSARHSLHGRLRLRCDLRHPALSITSHLPVITSSSSSSPCTTARPEVLCKETFEPHILRVFAVVVVFPDGTGAFLQVRLISPALNSFDPDGSLALTVGRVRVNIDRAGEAEHPADDTSLLGAELVITD